MLLCSIPIVACESHGDMFIPLGMPYCKLLRLSSGMLCATFPPPIADGCCVLHVLPSFNRPPASPACWPLQAMYRIMSTQMMYRGHLGGLDLEKPGELTEPWQ